MLKRIYLAKYAPLPPIITQFIKILACFSDDNNDDAHNFRIIFFVRINKGQEERMFFLIFLLFFHIIPFNGLVSFCPLYCNTTVIYNKYFFFLYEEIRWGNKLISNAMNSMNWQKKRKKYSLNRMNDENPRTTRLTWKKKITLFFDISTSAKFFGL